jgi:hypothetical protein
VFDYSWRHFERLLRSLKGLEDLFLQVWLSEEEDPEYFTSILHHKSTLKRLVYGQLITRGLPDWGNLVRRYSPKCIALECPTDEVVSQ